MSALLPNCQLARNCGVMSVKRAWLFVVMLEHGGGDFATVRRLPPPLSGVGLISNNFLCAFWAFRSERHDQYFIV